MKKCILYYIILFVALLKVGEIRCQIYEPGEPLSIKSKFNKNNKSITSETIFESNSFLLKKIDNQEEKSKAEKKAKECKSCYKNSYGIGIDTLIDLKKSGKFVTTSEGVKIWLLKGKHSLIYRPGYLFHRCGSRSENLPS
jgi:hypothetical protein